MINLKFIVRPLKSLRRTAARRAPGYIDACLRIGKLDAGTQSIIFTQAEFQTIRDNFNPSTSSGRDPKITAPGCC